MNLFTLILNALPEALGGMIAAAILGSIGYLYSKWRAEHPVNPRKILHNLPHPDYNQFVGREEEFQKVIDGLMGRSYLVSIDGVGGIGKTALAIEAGYRFLRHTVTSRGKKIRPRYYYNAIIWISAKRFSLREDSIITREQESQTLQDILHIIAITLELDEEKYLGELRNKKREIIRRELTKRRVLLIIDNFESVDDDAVLEFLKELPEPTKAIITTRIQIGETTQIHLPGLSEADAFNLMAVEAKLQAVTLTEEQMERLRQRTGSVPLAIVWTIARMKHFNVDDVLTDVHTNDASLIANFCFYEVVNSLKNKESYHTLLALSLFNDKASRESLGYVTGFPPYIRDATLVELEKFSLINKTGNMFWMLPLTREFAAAELNTIENDALKEKLQKQFADHYNQIKIKSVKHAASSIKAIHVALNLPALFVWNDMLADYLQANREAIKRGVRITRVFLMSKSVATDRDGVVARVAKILETQRAIGVNARLLWKEELDQHDLSYPPDLIVFDDKIVHLHQGSGGWYTDVDILDNEKQVEGWVRNFHKFEGYSHLWRGKEA